MTDKKNCKTTTLESTISNSPEMAAAVKLSVPKIRPGKGNKPVGIKLIGTDKVTTKSHPNQEARIIDNPEVIPDPEIISSPIDDEASKHKYPPPKNHQIFRKVWSQFIDNVCSRENFKVGHLNALEILCDLYVEYDELRTFLRTHGRTYKSFSRDGQIYKPYPEVGLLKDVQRNIKEYMKMLGLVLKKDHATESGGEKDNWE